MRKRLRKKLQRGEFVCHGFSVKIEHECLCTSTRSGDCCVMDSPCNERFEELARVLHETGLCFWGPLYDGIAGPAGCKGRPSRTATEADRGRVDDFLSRQAWVHGFALGPLRDLNETKWW